MKITKINIDTWQRKETYAMFRGMTDPFYALSFNIDVTEVYNFAKSKGISSYKSIVWVVTKALNGVENFRYTVLEDGSVGLLDVRNPSFTDFATETNCFKIVSMQFEDNIESFVKHASEKAEKQSEFIDHTEETPDLIYLSCVPWIDMTGVKSEGLEKPTDAIPRITWGKYRKENGRVYVNMTVETNHSFVDGYHIGKFIEEFTKIEKNL